MVPPATRMVPSFSIVALCPMRASVILPVGLNWPVAGSYSSARFTTEKSTLMPPDTSTMPFFSTVAACPRRALFMVPVKEKDPVLTS